jgi:hypothetical protein
MDKDKRETRISELEKEINIKSQELVNKHNELNRLKIEDRFEKLQLNPLKIGDIIRIHSNCSYPTMMKIESISEPMFGPLTIRGCGFIYNPIAQFITIKEDCSIHLNSCNDEIPTIELVSTYEWNEALEKIITKTDKMKC